MILSSDVYWQALGIPVWKLRAAESNSQEDMRVYLMLNQMNEMLAATIVKIQSAEQQNLLNNIANALEAQLSLIKLEDCVEQSPPNWLIFGEELLLRLAHLKLKHPLVVCDLQAMLNDPIRKKEVWQTIRVLKKS